MKFIIIILVIKFKKINKRLIDIAVSGSKTRLERERSVSAKDKILQKRKTQEKQVAALEKAIPMKQETRIYPKLCTHIS